MGVGVTGREVRIEVGVVWIGVVIGIAEWVGEATILCGVCGVEEADDVVHSDVWCAGTVGGEGVGGEWCGEECDAGGGGYVWGEGLELGGAAGDGAEGGADMGGAEGVATAEGGGCGEDGGGGAEGAVEDGEEVAGGREHGGRGGREGRGGISRAAGPMAGTNQRGRQTADGHARTTSAGDPCIDAPNNELAITICSSDRDKSRAHGHIRIRHGYLQLYH